MARSQPLWIFFPWQPAASFSSPSSSSLAVAILIITVTFGWSTARPSQTLGLSAAPGSAAAGWSSPGGPQAWARGGHCCRGRSACSACVLSSFINQTSGVLALVISCPTNPSGGPRGSYSTHRCHVCEPKPSISVIRCDRHFGHVPIHEPQDRVRVRIPGSEDRHGRARSRRLGDDDDQCAMHPISVARTTYTWERDRDREGEVRWGETLRPRERKKGSVSWPHGEFIESVTNLSRS